MQAETAAQVTDTFELQPRGAFSLAAAARFLSGFSPFSGTSSAHDGHVHLAFPVDGSEETVGVCLRERDGALTAEVVGQADPAAVRRQVARIFSLDLDGSGFAAVGERDPVIGVLQREYYGLRPVCFYSPYEAGAWALLSQRVQMTQAARIKAKLAAALGESVELHGQRVQAFPSPTRLLELESFPGLFGRKVEYLRGLAQATLDGRLDAERLRALPEEEALAALQRLPGVGEFSSRLILLRGAGTPDGPPAPEPRLLRAVALAYELPEPPGNEEFEQLADGWRPYRTWTAFLLRTMLADERSGR